MSWIYVTEPGAKLAKQGGRYVISRENETICEVPSAVVEGVTLFDSIQISSSVIVDFLERNIDLPYEQPLKLHGRYSRDQILSAFGENTFKSKSSNREGVANIEAKKTELLFVTFEKSEENWRIQIPSVTWHIFSLSAKYEKIQKQQMVESTLVELMK